MLPWHSLCVVAPGEENVLVSAPGPGPAPGSPLCLPFRAGRPPSVQWTLTYLQCPAQTPHCNLPHRVNCSLRLFVRIWKVLLLPCLPRGITGFSPLPSWEFFRVRQVLDSLRPPSMGWGSSRCWLKQYKYPASPRGGVGSWQSSSRACEHP